jgi:hypothetical protein
MGVLKPGGIAFIMSEPILDALEDDTRRVARLAGQLALCIPGAIVKYDPDVVQVTAPEIAWPEALEDYGVAFVVTPNHFEICLPSIKWLGPCDSIPTIIPWKRLELTTIDENDLISLSKLVDRGRKARRRQFKPCRFCQQRFPPEHRHDDVCHGCAESYPGVAH